MTEEEIKKLVMDKFTEVRSLTAVTEDPGKVYVDLVYDVEDINYMYLKYDVEDFLNKNGSLGITYRCSEIDPYE